MTDATILNEIWQIIDERSKNPSGESYTSKILTHRKGMDKSLEKVGEEATEFILAAKNQKEDLIVGEAADLIFHLLIAIKASGIDISAVYGELEARRRH